MQRTASGMVFSSCSESAIEESLSPQLLDVNDLLGWIGIEHQAGYDYAAIGNHGQLIYVSLETGIVIVRHGEK